MSKKHHRLDQGGYIFASQPINVDKKFLLYKGVNNPWYPMHEVPDIYIPEGSWQIVIELIKLPYLPPEEDNYKLKEIQSSVEG